MGTRVYVGNLSFNTNEESLRAACAADGRNVAKVSIVTDRDTGRSRGFAFVEMTDAAAATKAITALDGSDLGGRPMKVNEARPKEKSSGGGGGRGGKFGGGGGGRDDYQGHARQPREPRW